MKFIMDRGLIRGRIWLANGTSDAHVTLVWVEMGRGLFSLHFGLGLFSLNISSHLEAIYSYDILFVVLKF
jgi:hypothetical protein